MKTPHPLYTDQLAIVGNHRWNVLRLIALTKDFEVMNIPLKHLNMCDKYENIYMREMVGHCEAINNADLKYPIILDEDGAIMDGRHRLMKAMLLNKKTIKAVRFDVNPSPCSYVN